MPVRAHDEDPARAPEGQPVVRIAAVGDTHLHESSPAAARAVFAEAADGVDALLLAGDLTTLGEPEQAQVAADALRDVGVPAITVLGNHDWHANRRDELVATLEDAGVVVLDPGHHVFDVDGLQVGVAGVKGSIGGFPPSTLPDFGEPLLREVYADTSREAAALDEHLRAISHCQVRIALLHYAPCTETLEGEPREIWAFLGSHRLAPPIVEHGPDLVLHGHAHVGTFAGSIGPVPVHNVAQALLGGPVARFELEPAAQSSIH